MKKLSLGIAVLALLVSSLAAVSAYERKSECQGGIWMEKPEGFWKKWTAEYDRDGRFIPCNPRNF